MKKTLLLKAEIREKSGTHSAVSVRKLGRIPAVIYGHKQEPMLVSFNGRDLIEGFHSGQRMLEVEVGSKKETVLFKDLQYDYLGKNIVHVDLMRVDAAELVKVSIPIELKGVAKGTQEGGIVESHAGSLEVECKVNNIPEIISISVKEMGVGDSIHAGDVELGAGVKLVSSPGILVAICNLVAAAKSTEELEEEAPSAPEIIGEVKDGQAETAKE